MIEYKNIYEGSGDVDHIAIAPFEDVEATGYVGIQLYIHIRDSNDAPSTMYLSDEDALVFAAGIQLAVRQARKEGKIHGQG